MKLDGQSNLRLKFTLLLLFFFCSQQSSALSVDQLETISALKQQATSYRLNGDYTATNLISAELQTSFPNDGIGYTVSLNTLTTLLSWDSNEVAFDKTFKAHAARALTLCEAQIKTDPEDYRGYYHCGQANFALSYLHALRGNYYRSGTSGTRAIENLERTLVLNPQLVDAKMHLGIAYYYADNLPPFVKAVSRFFWFIPTGNSHKSLPYVKSVVDNGEYFKDVAKYLYADILIDGDTDDRQLATTLLQELVSSYPPNRRFALRHISLLVERDLNLQAITAANKFISSEDEYSRREADVYLARLWVARAHLSLGDKEAAIAEFEKISDSSSLSSFPSWARSWFELTRAQIHDLQNQRAEAINAYHAVINMQADFVSHRILDAAKQGLESPFNVDSQGTTGSARDT